MCAPLGNGVLRCPLLFLPYFICHKQQSMFFRAWLCQALSGYILMLPEFGGRPIENTIVGGFVSLYYHYFWWLSSILQKKVYKFWWFFYNKKKRLKKGVLSLWI